MQQPITLTLEKPFRDDIKGGIYLKSKLKGFSPTDYTKAECYIVGSPVNMCIAFFDHRRMNTGGMCAEVAIAGDDYQFTKKNINKLLALFFNNRHYKGERLQALIPVWNKQARRLLHISGFTKEGRLRKVAKDGDRFIYSLLKQEYHERNI
jgi:hypothetical protein